MQRRASRIIIHAVMDKPHRVIRSNVGNPFRTIMKLDERYDSKSTATPVSRVTELMSLRYTSPRRNIWPHIEEMVALLEEPDSMNMKMPDELEISFLISSVYVAEMAPVKAAITTRADRRATWESVTARIIEEHMLLKSKNGSNERLTVAGVAKQQCSIC